MPMLRIRLDHGSEDSWKEGEYDNYGGAGDGAFVVEQNGEHVGIYIWAHVVSISRHLEK